MSPTSAISGEPQAPGDKASVLVESLPYIRRFWGKVVVVKYGGNVLRAKPGEDAVDETAALASFAEDIVLMRSVGMLPVVVHGGGPQIGALMARVGKEVEFLDGFRVTDAETIDLVRMVLVGKVNRDIVSSINVHGALAVGLSGEDANLITATARSEALGYVGDVVHVDPVIVHQLLAQGLIPVVATLGPGLQHQRRHCGRGPGRGPGGRETGVPDRRVGSPVGAGRSRHPHQPGHGGRVGRAGGIGSGHRGDDPQGGGVRPGRPVRGRARPHPRRAHTARPAAGGVHRPGGGHHGGGDTMMSGTARSDAVPTAPVPTVDRSALMSTYAEPSVTFVSGQGSVLVDTEGRRYLDFLSGLAVTSLGHAHPAVADAVADQARTLCHVSNLFGNVVGPDVAVTLDRLIGGGSHRAGGQVFFGNSGAEANECALKLARRWAGPGRHAVVSTWDAFHGRTLGTLAATGQVEKQRNFAPMPEGFDHVAFDDLESMDAACDPDRVAAVLVEPILGEAGVVVPSSDYLAGLRQLCTDRNILLMVDEVQTGLGRTGQWFGFQHLGVEPDVVTMAKALGNGMPVGACWARAEVAAAFVPGDHGSTFGGQPLAMSAARATLAVMESEDVPGRARRAGARLRAGLEQLPGVVSVRGEGLLLAAVLAGPFAAATVRESLTGGLVVNAPRPDTLRFAPSLLVSDPEIDQALAILGPILSRGAAGIAGSTS